MDLKVRTIVILVTAAVFLLVVAVASYLQRTALEIEETLIPDMYVTTLDIGTVQHNFYIDPSQLKQFILNNQIHHRILLFNGNSNASDWGSDRFQFTINDFNTQQVVFFRVFRERVNELPGVSQYDEFSLITISEGGPPINNITGEPYIGRTLLPPYVSRPNEPLEYADNSRQHYNIFIEVTSPISGGYYNLIQAFLINAQLDEFSPQPENIHYKIERWVDVDGSLILTITPENVTVDRPFWLNHQRVTDMIQG